MQKIKVYLIVSFSFALLRPHVYNVNNECIHDMSTTRNRFDCETSMSLTIFIFSLLTEFISWILYVHFTNSNDPSNFSALNN